ncbi:hypothetical protein LCGC14_0261400 [marine sediment metagenome]|uniref:Tc1-like transposase DDE domain-containing protein n=1 Tax=marine sediment metagenome TaxID=412755 RepID=A0A0F9U658_9ZZZZ
MDGDQRSGRIEAEADFLLALVDDADDITLHEMQRRLADDGIEVGIGSLWRFFDRSGITWKKTAHASEQDRPDVLKARQEWFDGQIDLDTEKLVLIDKTGLSTKMARRYGRSPGGKRCGSGVPHGHWKTTTFTGALRLTGTTAPMVLDGALNGIAFHAYVEQVLVPTLNPGDVVVIDYLPAHKANGVCQADGVRRAIEQAGGPVAISAAPTAPL